MPVFRYQALSADGRTVKGQVDADNPKQAKDKLRQDKLFATKIEQLKEGAAPTNSTGNATLDRLGQSFQAIFTSVSVREIANLTRQMAVLLRAGIPLVQTLTALIDQAEKESLHRVLSQVRDDVNEGGSMADSLAKHPQIFSSLYINMVRAGESSGTMEVVLARLADFLDGQAALRQKIGQAMAYPIVIMLVMIGALVFMVYFVIPNMLKVFEQSDMQLPIYTRILIGFVELFQGYWWAILMAVVALIIGFQRIASSEKGRNAMDAFKFKIPIVKKIVLYLAIARFSRTLGTLLKSGVSMIVSLRIVTAVVGNKVMRDIFLETERAVTEGASLAQPLKASGMFPSTVVHMINAGEQSGELEEMLLRVAETYEGEVESYTVILTAALEPLIIVVMTLMVGFVLVSVLLPMMQMNSIL